MFCPKCGKALENNSLVFCPHCGTRIEKQRSQQNAGYQQSGNYRQPSPHQQFENYQQLNLHQKSENNEQPNPHQQSGNYQQLNLHQKSGNNEQPSSHQQSGNYQQLNLHQQPGDYQQPDNHQQFNPYWQPGAFPQQTMCQQTELPMNWYKFVIYFMLFANAAFGIIGAIGYFSGATTSSLAEGKVSAEWIYAMYPALRWLMYFMGAVSLGMAVLAIIDRQWLAHFDKRGIPALAALYIIGVVSTLIYAIGLITILKVGLGDFGPVMVSSVVGSVVGSIVALVLNMVYFNKRAHLFH